MSGFTYRSDRFIWLSWMICCCKAVLAYFPITIMALIASSNCGEDASLDKKPSAPAFIYGKP
ncbi:hypothetical protein D3C86_2021670 [compost metagenome]